MLEIFYEIPIGCSSDKLFNAITSETSISEWWLKGASYKAEVGALGAFPLSDGSGMISMRVEDLILGKKQVWRCLEHKNADWLDTVVTFEIDRESDLTCILRFKHSNWKTVSSVFGRVSFFWAALYLRNLKLMLESPCK
jgi:activator of HSP90 ATPase